MAEELKIVKCQHCGSAMNKTKKSDVSIGLQLVGVFLFFLGIAMFFMYFPLGLILGIIVMIVSARLGFKQKKVWMCSSCKFFFERA